MKIEDLTFNQIKQVINHLNSKVRMLERELEIKQEDIKTLRNPETAQEFINWCNEK